jgi:hypothetical protein
VPAPVLVNELAPAIPWEIVVEKLLVSMVPPPALSVIARVLDRSKVAPNCNVPPPKLSPRVAAPRLLSADTASVPALSDVPPE